MQNKITCTIRRRYLIMTYRAKNLPNECPTNDFYNRAIPEVYRLVDNIQFNDTDFLSPAEKDPKRKPRKNMNLCTFNAVSIGSYEYCLNTIKKHPTNFGHCHIAKGFILMDMGVCDNSDYHINFFPYEKVSIFDKFQLYSTNDDIKRAIEL